MQVAGIWGSCVTRSDVVDSWGGIIGVAGRDDGSMVALGSTVVDGHAVTDGEGSDGIIIRLGVSRPDSGASESPVVNTGRCFAKRTAACMSGGRSGSSILSCVHYQILISIVLDYTELDRRTLAKRPVPSLGLPPAVPFPCNQLSSLSVTEPLLSICADPALEGSSVDSLVVRQTQSSWWR